eukprot:9491345-Pyramimonas_sp.AAC.1
MPGRCSGSGGHASTRGMAQASVVGGGQRPFSQESVAGLPVGVMSHAVGAPRGCDAGYAGKTGGRLEREG